MQRNVHLAGHSLPQRGGVAELVIRVERVLRLDAGPRLLHVVAAAGARARRGRQLRDLDEFGVADLA